MAIQEWKHESMVRKFSCRSKSNNTRGNTIKQKKKNTKTTIQKNKKEKNNQKIDLNNT